MVTVTQAVVAPTLGSIEENEVTMVVVQECGDLALVARGVHPYVDSAGNGTVEDAFAFALERLR